jgi:integrase
MSKNKKRVLFQDYFLNRIASLEAERRYATAANYRSVYSSLQTFCERKPIWVDRIDRDLVCRYNAFLYKRGVCRNTVSFYNRVLRAVCNQAQSEGYTITPNLFSGQYTGVDQTRKRALTMQVMRRIHSFDTDGDKELTLTRNLFLFSFYARGMCFVDLAYLTKRNISGDMLSYLRHKTGQCINIRLEPCMKTILKKYEGHCFGEYLFPIIESDDPVVAYRQYVHHRHRYNLRLKEIGSQCGAGNGLTSYAARHSWATLAQQANVPVSLISSGLGHHSEKTTQIYLDSLSQTQVDKANGKMLKYLFKER